MWAVPKEKWVDLFSQCKKVDNISHGVELVSDLDLKCDHGKLNYKGVMPANKLYFLYECGILMDKF